jgi:hypothetical protein
VAEARTGTARMSEAGTIYGLAHGGEIRYVGKTIQDPAVRLRAHVGTARRDRRGQRHLSDWLRSIGYAPSVVVLERCRHDMLNEAEKSWIATARSYGCRLVNMTDGGDGQRPGYRHTPDARARQSAAQKGKTPRRGSEWREKVAASNRARNLGKPLSEETRRKLSEALRGRKRKPHSAETREKISAVLMARPDRTPHNKGKVGVSPETRARMSASARARDPKTRACGPELGAAISRGRLAGIAARKGGEADARPGA